MNGRAGPKKTLCSLSLSLLPRASPGRSSQTHRPAGQSQSLTQCRGLSQTGKVVLHLLQKTGRKILYVCRLDCSVALPAPGLFEAGAGHRGSISLHLLVASQHAQAQQQRSPATCAEKCLQLAITGQGHSTAGFVQEEGQSKVKECQPIQQMTGTAMNGTTMPLPMIAPSGAGMRGKNPQTIVTATKLQVLGAGVSMNGLITPATRAIATQNGATLPQARKTTGTTMSGQRAGKKGKAGRRQVNIIRDRTKTKTSKITKITASPIATTSPTGTGGAMRSSPVAGAGTGPRTAKTLTTSRAGVKLVQATGSPIATASATPNQRHAKTQTILGRAARGGKIAITGGGGTAAHNGH